MPATERPSFREALTRRPILLDAAMGTRLVARGLDLASDDPCRWVLDHEFEVKRLHQADLAAGAEALLTNTFGANRVWLDRFGDTDRVRSINSRAVEIAREVAGAERYVIGSIGPTAPDHPEALREQAEVLVASGVDALILETQTLELAQAALRSLNNELRVPILVSLYDWPEPIDRSAGRLIDLGASAIGANCQLGMAPAMVIARRLRRVCGHPLLIKPSAGLPGTPLEAPEVFEAAVPELLDLGVRLLGGCCGTTEAHVAALRAGLSAEGNS